MHGENFIFAPSNHLPMYQTERYLARQTPLVQLLILILLVLFSLLITFLAGMLLAIPLFGLNVMDLFSNAASLSGPEDVAVMKYFQIVSQLGMFIIPSFVFAILISRRPANYLRFNRWPGLLTVIATIILLFTILPGINWLIGINEKLSLPDWMGAIENWMRASEESAARITEAFLKTTSAGGLILNLFMVAFMAALGEELLFRGLGLRIFQNMFGNVHAAVWFSAVVFSVFHLQFFGFLPRLALGALFGYLLVWSGSLWLPIIAHFINNAAAVMVYYFHNVGATETPAENFGNVDNTLLFIVSLLASAALMFMIYHLNRNKLKPENKNVFH